MLKPIEAYIDHTLLKFDATKEDVVRLCKEAVDKKFAAVCIPPYLLQDAGRYIRESSTVKLCTVIGFPFGYNEVSVKNNECKSAIDDGAEELDVVVNISAVKSNDWETVESEIDALATTISMKDKVIKLILETGVMSQYEIEKLCALCLKYEIDYAKTSTGINGSGATVETILFMKTLLNKKVKIKASGGIKTLEQVKAMIAAGADRIGTSHAMSF